MAEVRKKVIEDKYNTSSIKIKEKGKETKKEPKKKTVKKVVTKVEEKPNLFVRFRLFCSGVKSEFLKVHWTSKNDMVKYSIATIFFIIFCSLFFYLIYVLFALVQSLFA
jgi:preprotein translocase SecE subunit